MSLVVGRLVDNTMRIIADGRRVNPHAVTAGPLEGLLKVVVVNPDLCVCYAGRVGHAVALLEDVFTWEKQPHDEVVARCLEEHLSSNEETDFIVASKQRQARLTRITSSAAMDTNSCWIGDFDAFEAFQRHRQLMPIVPGSELLNRAQQVQSEMSHAMSELIRTQEIASVGDFSVSVAHLEDGFQYLDSLTVFAPPQRLPPGKAVPLSYGTAATGGYGYTVLVPRAPGVGAIALYFPHARIGVLYYPRHSSDPLLYRNTSHQELCTEIERIFGFRIDGIRFS